MYACTKAAATVYPRTCGGTVDAISISAASTGLSPHVRGNQETLVLMLLEIGLSPHVRGNPLSMTYSIHTKGSIPARAGEPRQDFTDAPHPRVYPRTCGGPRGQQYF